VVETAGFPDWCSRPIEFTQLVPRAAAAAGRAGRPVRGLQNLEQLCFDPGRWGRLQPWAPSCSGVAGSGEHERSRWCWMGLLALLLALDPAAISQFGDRRLPPLLPALNLQRLLHDCPQAVRLAFGGK